MSIYLKIFYFKTIYFNIKIRMDENVSKSKFTLKSLSEKIVKFIV